MRLSVVPNRISECEAEVSVDIEDLCAVEGGGWVAVDGEGYALFAGEFNALDNFRICDEIKAVAVFGIFYALMEIGSGNRESLSFKIEVTAHSCVADAHLNADWSANKIALAQMLNVGNVLALCGIDGGQSLIGAAGVSVAARTAVKALALGEKVAIEFVVILRVLRFERFICDLDARVVAEPIVERVIREHLLLRVRMNEESTEGENLFNDLGEALAGEFRVDEVTFRTALKLIFGEGVKQFLGRFRTWEDHIVMHRIELTDGVADSRSGLCAADKNAVLPFGEIHMAHLLVVEDGGKVEPERLHCSLPMVKIALTVRSSAGCTVVVKLSVKCPSALIKRRKMGNFFICCVHYLSPPEGFDFFYYIIMPYYCQVCFGY